MKLEQLISDLSWHLAAGDAGVTINDITDDSRQAGEGWAFVARVGADGDGSIFIDDAIARGASAIIAVAPPPAPAHLPRGLAWVVAPQLGQAECGLLAERLFGHPSKQLSVIAITGTNGKTTTAFIAQHLLNLAGFKCGLIGTVANDDGAGRQPAPLTTPGAIDFSRLLARMVANGCEAVAAETSSHGLHQGRVAAISIDVGVFTNLTGDHLDYHKTIDNYAAAKAMLFEQLPASGWAVVNADDKWMPRMIRDCKAHIAHCTVDGSAEKEDCRYRATILSIGADGSRVRLDGAWGSVDLRLPLVGRHNVYNALQAAAAASSVASIDRVLRTGLEQCAAPPGRLELVRADWVNRDAMTGGGASAVGPALPAGRSPLSPASSTTAAQANAHWPAQPALPASAVPAIIRGERLRTLPQPTVLVDYAHTHDALENVLKALRPLTRGKLIVLFGCGGDRDRTKRSKMARVACELADRIYITSDNPRTEDPQQIFNDILQGVPDGAKIASIPEDGDVTDPIASNPTPHTPHPTPQILLQSDRAAAIAAAIAAAGPDDVVLLAGKGHEDYQIIGREKRHFDDREHAAAALQGWLRQPMMA